VGVIVKVVAGNMRLGLIIAALVVAIVSTSLVSGVIGVSVGVGARLKNRDVKDVPVGKRILPKTSPLPATTTTTTTRATTTTVPRPAPVPVPVMRRTTANTAIKPESRIKTNSPTDRSRSLDSYLSVNFDAGTCTGDSTAYQCVNVGIDEGSQVVWTSAGSIDASGAVSEAGVWAWTGDHQANSFQYTLTQTTELPFNSTMSFYSCGALVVNGTGLYVDAVGTLTWAERAFTDLTWDAVAAAMISSVPA